MAGSWRNIFGDIYSLYFYKLFKIIIITYNTNKYDAYDNSVLQLFYNN